MNVERTEDFAALLPRYGEADKQFALIRAVLEGSQPGTAHLFEGGGRCGVFVANRFGFAQFFGDSPDSAMTNCLFDTLCRDPALCHRYLLWYDPPELCSRYMDKLPDDTARVRTRISLTLDPERFVAPPPIAAMAGQKQEELEIVLLDNRIMDQLDAFSLEIDSRFWPSRKAFLEQGLGVAVRADGRVASVCYAACVADRVAEVDVATLEAFRGQGLARIATAAFVSACLKKHVRPNWDCFDYNQSSLQLAVGLGFTEVFRYPFYTVNT